MAEPHDTQRIARLTPLKDVLARIDEQVKPVEPRRLPIADALGRTLADDVVAGPSPAVAIALRDGWAVDSSLTIDASAYAPPSLPHASLIDVGQPMPAGADAIAPFDAVIGRDGRYEVFAPVTPGEGVLAAGANIPANSILRRAGERLRDIDVAVLTAAGVMDVVVREPRIRLVTARAQGDAALNVARGLIARLVEAEGGAVRAESGPVAAAFADETVDAVLVIGGTGSGRGDASVHTLARFGRVDAHGIALAPGETAGFGLAHGKPVLLVPGRFDSALAVWLALGSALLTRLGARTEADRTVTIALSRKVASALGMAEIVPVRCSGGTAEPLASGHLPLQAIAPADGWIMVPPESEGFPAGAEVVVRFWR